MAAAAAVAVLEITLLAMVVLVDLAAVVQERQVELMLLQILELLVAQTLAVAVALLDTHHNHQ
jgi:hypothetical protein